MIKWLLDSGCWAHLINDESYYSSCCELKKPIDVNFPDSSVSKATKIGKLTVYFEVKDRVNQIKLKNVFFVENLRNNIMCFSKIAKTSRMEVFENRIEIYNKIDDKLEAIANEVADLYFSESFVNIDDRIVPNSVNTNTLKQTGKERRHRALGHVNFDYLDEIIKNKTLCGLSSKLEKGKMTCVTCLQSKMASQPFKNDREHANEILQIIHTDLNGPHEIRGYRGKNFFNVHSKCTSISKSTSNEYVKRARVRQKVKMKRSIVLKII